MTHQYDPGPVGEPYASLVGELPRRRRVPARLVPSRVGSDLPPRTARRQRPAARDRAGPRPVRGGRPADPRRRGRTPHPGADGEARLHAQLSADQHVPVLGLRPDRRRAAQGRSRGSSTTATAGCGASSAATRSRPCWRWGRSPTTRGRSGSRRRSAQTYSPAYAHVTHPTEPESSSGGDPAKLKAAIAAMLAELEPGAGRAPPAGRPSRTCRGRSFPTADSFAPGDRIEIPEFDAPAGIPEWMRSPAAWAQRVGKTAAEKRANITITIPAGVI